MNRNPGGYSAEKIEKILSDSVNIEYLKNKKKSAYDYTYDTFLEYFVCLSQQDTKSMTRQAEKKWLIGGTSLVYSWMPTILKFRTDHEKCALSSLCKIREIIDHKNKYFAQDDDCIEGQLEPLRDFINNAIVGPSKFLHFSFPEVFPIWDRRVERVFGKKAYPHRLTNNKDSNSNSNSDIGYYLEYARSVHEVCNKKKHIVKLLDDIELLKNKTCIRKVEYALFLIAGKKKNKDH